MIDISEMKSYLMDLLPYHLQVSQEWDGHPLHLHLPLLTDGLLVLDRGRLRRSDGSDGWCGAKAVCRTVLESML
jgi:hypothetical protein